MLEDPLPAEAGLRILSDRGGEYRLGAAAGFRTDQRVDAAGGKRDDPGGCEVLDHIARHEGVHRPGQLLGAVGAELAPRHENHVRNPRQLADLFAVEQVARDGFDAPRFKFFAVGGLAEAGDADHLLLHAREFDRPRRAPSHRQAHLPGDAENHQVAVEAFHHFDPGGGGGGKQFFKFLFRPDRIRIPHCRFSLPFLVKPLFKTNRLFSFIKITA